MAAYMALIERSNRKDLTNVEVQVTITDLSPGRQSWSGEFVSRTGQKGTARVSDTLFDSRTPDTTLVHFTGTSPLA